MKTINSIDELAQLQLKEKFYKISDGHCTGFIFAGIHPMNDKLIVSIPSYDYSSATVFSKANFEYSKAVFLKGKYNSKKVGLLMIKQNREHIKSIRKIYLKST